MMKRFMTSAVYLICLCLSAMVGCTDESGGVVELKRYPLDDLSGVITKTNVRLDRTVTVDGKGSLRVDTDRPLLVRLYETGDIDVENARLTYSAKVRTEAVEGVVFIEMWCRFPGKGEFFSRGLQSPVTGTTDWVSVQTPFLLKKGENPDNIKLNLVINGSGTAWIDDIHLIKKPI